MALLTPNVVFPTPTDSPPLRTPAVCPTIQFRSDTDSAGLEQTPRLEASVPQHCPPCSRWVRVPGAARPLARELSTESAMAPSPGTNSVLRKARCSLLRVCYNGYSQEQPHERCTGRGGSGDRPCPPWLLQLPAPQCGTRPRALRTLLFGGSYGGFMTQA